MVFRIATVVASTASTAFASCPNSWQQIGSPPLHQEEFKPLTKEAYHKYLADLDIEKLYETIVETIKASEECWPADGPQDGDVASYAGLFGRLAWHCSGTLRVIDGVSSGGCEGGRNRHWPEREWRDNANLDKARAILSQVKQMPRYQQLSWGDLITFAGTVGLKASGGPAEKFCFGRVDDEDGRKSIMLGTEGIEQCEFDNCRSMSPCENNFHWPEQDPKDDARCNLTQSNGRQQGSHSVGLIYVFPHGPQLRADQPDFDASQLHQRSPKLSAKEVRDTFQTRMGWTDQETVALIGGGHTLGRSHGNCASLPHGSSTKCTGAYTTSSGYEGAWTRTPSQWNYDFFEAMLEHEWVPTQSPDGLDQWGPKNTMGKFANTFRLTSDLSLVNDPIYRQWAITYKNDHNRFDADFATAWFKLTHRSTNHPRDDDLETDAGKCTDFKFAKSISV